MNKTLTLIFCLSLLAIGSTALADTALTPDSISTKITIIRNELPNEDAAIQEYLKSIEGQTIVGSGSPHIVEKTSDDSYYAVINLNRNNTATIRKVSKVAAINMKKYNKMWFTGTIQSVDYYSTPKPDFFIIINIEYSGVVFK